LEAAQDLTRAQRLSITWPPLRFIFCDCGPAGLLNLRAAVRLLPTNGCRRPSLIIQAYRNLPVANAEQYQGDGHGELNSEPATVSFHSLVMLHSFARAKRRLSMMIRCR
jgi:hypothetical protein